MSIKKALLFLDLARNELTPAKKDRKVVSYARRPRKSANKLSVLEREFMTPAAKRAAKLRKPRKVPK